MKEDNMENNDRSERFMWNEGDIEILPSEEIDVRVDRQILKSQFDEIIFSFESLLENPAENAFLQEIPQHSLNVFKSEGQNKFKEIYTENRKAGSSIEDSLDLTAKIVSRNFKYNKVNILKAIGNELSKIKKSLNRKK